MEFSKSLGALLSLRKLNCKKAKEFEKKMLESDSYQRNFAGKVTWMDGAYNSSKGAELMRQGILFTGSSGERCLPHHNNKDVEMDAV